MSVAKAEFRGGEVSGGTETSTTKQVEMEVSDGMGVLRAEVAPNQPDANSAVDNNQQQQPTETRPEWLPKKFNSPEDMAKAYSELEKKLASGNKKETTPNATEKDKDQSNGDNKAGEVPAEQQAVEGDKDKASVEKAVGGAEQFSKYSEEYQQSGSLSEESYKELESKGIPKDIVDAYIRGQEALIEAQVTTVYNQVGGKEQYQQMLEWAESSLPQAEVDAFNNIVASGDQSQTLLAVNGLYARYSSVSKAPKLVNGAPSVNGRTGNVFRSTGELVAAMSDPRYKTDAAYRADVERRLEMSDIL
jgi:hypothetical protein